MIAISARITLAPEFTDAFSDAAAAIIAPTRKEAGCNYYAFGRDLEESNVILISEEWASEQALLDHLKSPHITDFLRKTQSMTMLGFDVKKYRVSSVGGMDS
ncbi:antibiotic biosynthesis monooxygenase [Duganella sp. FT92W]|uniref:Antibiotic biosynthesis monooxygenase n=1 Tax=Pseudoduganella rivuli TaxID=2666085 RepID=A0A7X2IKS8_9BURK|nr:putative quinol monooxygenase [Pseudoduganella rivuli]MRV71664.1 antibiotic biosynthesis monooxygenase [Pseudoduganella rivuli]